MRDAYSEELKRLRVRLGQGGDRGALHWRGVPDEEGAEAAIRAVAERAEGLQLPPGLPWGRKVLEIRPPVRIDKGAGIVGLLRDSDLAAMYVGDDLTDVDAFRGLGELVEMVGWAPPCGSACAPTRGRRCSQRRPTSWWTAPTACC